MGRCAERLARARDIVLEHGWNATSYQILNPGVELWFSRRNHAVVGYRRRSGVLVVAGAPVCPEGALTTVCAEFEEYAREWNATVCYVCAEDRLRGLLAGSGEHAVVTVGAQPAWDPRCWPQVMARKASLRAQLHRARNHGVRVDLMWSDSELRGVLEEWVRARALPPLRFLAGVNALDGVLTDRVILVARQEGRPVGFAVASPARARGGYLLELLARSRQAPNGVSEMLIAASMQRFAVEGCSYATLGLVALARAAEAHMRANPHWLQAMTRVAREHANRLYNFRGLEQFRVKLSPQRWEPVYVISNERAFSLRSLYAVGAAFTGMPPFIALCSALIRASAR
ncbi:MAG: DUF2156 domain-containing protein [Bryobacterales bacterium]|nr:DUF2156 domain-containing protein [Bryobacterales bacterium]